MVWFFLAGWLAGVVGTLLFGYVMLKKDGHDDERS